MADPPPYTGAGDTDIGADRGSATGASRWVSVLGITAAIVVVLLIVVLHLTGTLGPGMNP
ncbi:MAG: hypothetical protein HYX52_08630 [Chloroflexi bacterium]|nr:hypothetical protein [Chloroflexota bacterium]